MVLTIILDTWSTDSFVASAIFLIVSVPTKPFAAPNISAEEATCDTPAVMAAATAPLTAPCATLPPVAAAVNAPMVDPITTPPAAVATAPVPRPINSPTVAAAPPPVATAAAAAAIITRPG